MNHWSKVAFVELLLPVRLEPNLPGDLDLRIAFTLNWHSILYNLV